MERLKEAIRGRLINVELPFAACADKPNTSACEELQRNLRNPFFVGTNRGGRKAAVGRMPGFHRRASMRSPLKVRATSRPQSILPANALSASSSKAAATVFTARRTRLICCWPRAMDKIVLRDGFCAAELQHAAKAGGLGGAGVIWLHLYDTVVTKAGRYLQGGGCTTVGVAGLSRAADLAAFRDIMAPRRHRCWRRRW